MSARSHLQSMAKACSNGKTIDSYTIKGIDKPIRSGDCVLMRPPNPSKLPYIAKVDKIESDNKESNVKVHIRWYYRPNDVIGGNQPFHGTQEVFLSDHSDIQSVDTIEGKCTVHTLKRYTNLKVIGDNDFFCRFKYYSSTGEFHPNDIDIYCKCKMPYNPDHLMVECDGCSDWFHLECINMTVKEAKRMDHFYCESCSSEKQRILRNSHVNSRHATKVDTKRRRR